MDSKEKITKEEYLIILNERYLDHPAHVLGVEIIYVPNFNQEHPSGLNCVDKDGNSIISGVAFADVDNNMRKEYEVIDL